MPFNTPEKAKAYRLKNRERRNQQNKEWYSRNPTYAMKMYVKHIEERLQQAKTQYEKSGRKKHLLKNYNITPEQHDAIFTFQQKRCGICQSTDPGAKGLWYVDHDHNGQKIVRGILCLGCNRTLGYIERRPILLMRCEAFKEYLENPPAQQVLNPYPALNSGLHSNTK